MQFPHFPVKFMNEEKKMAVKIGELVSELNLEILNKGNEDILINVSDINRPGLQLAGFYNYFAQERIQVIGRAEWSYLDAMQNELREKRLKKFFGFNSPCTIIARGLSPHQEILKYASLNNRWLLRTDVVTSRFTSRLMYFLDEKLAPEIRVHGVLVDVYGTGILITGESGIGKSETALELIKRGHRLVADDAVDIKEIDGSLKGACPYITKGMLEVRGMGIIDVPSLYGLSSLSSDKNIDLVIDLKQWNSVDDFERLGLDSEKVNILGVDVKKITIPIRPGRNVAVIIEAAAVNYRYSLTSASSPIDIINNRIETTK